MNKIKSFSRHPQLALLFAAIVFIIDFLSVLLAFLIMFALSHFGLIADDWRTLPPLVFFAAVFLIMCTVVAVLLNRFPMKPLTQICDAADKIADGDYSVRINLKGPKDLRILSRKFNHMAQELGSVEMLRSDFVNNFSHEFKTPIASIQGFAQVLLDRDVPPQEQEEYLGIIVKESKRLTDLATNVLYLSKVEQQTILTDKKACNICEQIRGSIITLDMKWAEKLVEIQMDNEEDALAVGNEELLKQVWLNLLDNAFKFSPKNGLIKIAVNENANGVEVIISNQGDTLSSETCRHIFDRFYQGDTSHTGEGNGLGLTIAKKIVELHNGQIFADCPGEGLITFHVQLPGTSNN